MKPPKSPGLSERKGVNEKANPRPSSSSIAAKRRLISQSRSPISFSKIRRKSYSDSSERSEDASRVSHNNNEEEPSNLMDQSASSVEESLISTPEVKQINIVVYFIKFSSMLIISITCTM